MARSPLTETFNRVQAMVAHVRENLNPGEYFLFLDMVAPQPEPEPAAKKIRKKRERAEPLSDERRQAVHKRGLPQSNGQLCIAKILGLDVECGDPEDNRVHDKSAGYAGYHPFQASASVQPAEKKSKKKDAVASINQNSEIDKAAAISAGS